MVIWGLDHQNQNQRLASQVCQAFSLWLEGLVPDRLNWYVED